MAKARFVYSSALTVIDIYSSMFILASAQSLLRIFRSANKKRAIPYSSCQGMSPLHFDPFIFFIPIQYNMTGVAGRLANVSFVWILLLD